ncbi:MAG: response regulator [Alphaproteobacteria bacterium]|nr:response regulator [Alphaproteobacteria bacterium]MBT5860092.1 response regulator [Alphaproteobacteria bacterium]
MAKPNEDFADAVVLLIDPDKGSRDTIKTILYDRGFRKFRYGQTIAEMKDQVTKEHTDVLITETDLPDGDPCEMISAIRHNGVGKNPFLPIIVTTWQPTPDIVRKIVDSGSDDLVIKPVSVGGLVSRVENLIHNRKDFVVTSDYIGPDRHDTPGRDEEEKTDLLVVPNALKAVVTGAPEESTAQAEIQEMIAEINVHKLERYAVDIVSLVTILVPKVKERVFDSDSVKLLERLLDITGDAHRRMEGTKYAHVSQLCDTLAKVTHNLITHRAKAAEKDVRLLRPLSQAIQAGFDSSDVTAAAARAISSTIDAGHMDLKEIRTDLQAKAVKPKPKPVAPADPGKPKSLTPTADALLANADAIGTGRRTKFVLRLLIARVSHLFRSSDKASHQRLPREFIHGFDNYLKKLLGANLYLELNEESKDLLGVIDSDDDALIWKKIYQNPKYRVFSLSILIRFLQKFENFNRGKRYFMSIINASVMGDGAEVGLEDFVMDDGQFNMVFGTMFSDIFKIMGDEESAGGFDNTFGGGTWASLDLIRTAYQEYLVLHSDDGFLPPSDRKTEPDTGGKRPIG